jgi:general secretion pathway protein K
VLWSLALVALIGTQVTSAGHTEAHIAANLRSSAVAEAAADAAVEETGLHLLDPGRGHWLSDLLPYVVRMPQATVLVSISAEARKLPLNTAPTQLIAAVLRQVGVDPRLAAVLGDQIGDWRSPANFPLKLGAKAPAYKSAGRLWGPANRAFRSRAELRLVLSMTPAIYASFAPHVSVYTQSAPQALQADPVVGRAILEMAASGLQPLSFDEAPVFRVTAVATSRDGGRFVRRAVLRVNVPGQAQDTTRPFDILAWSSGESEDRG